MSSALHARTTSPPGLAGGSSCPGSRMQSASLVWGSRRRIGGEIERDSGGDGDPPPSWSEEDVVLLHWFLLKEVQRLADPEAPFAEKIWTLNWVFTDPDKDALPFSFANCVKSRELLSAVAFAIHRRFRRE